MTRPASTAAPATLDDLRRAIANVPGLGPGFRPAALSISPEGTVTLAGEAPSLAAKKRALLACAALPGVAAIVDRLHVMPAAAMGDGEIAAHLAAALGRDLSFAGCAVRTRIGTRPDFELVAEPAPGARCGMDIEVHAGIVTLGGQVAGLAGKRLAGVLAWWVPGVRDVINGLEPDPPEEDAPIRIEEAVRLAFERNPCLPAGQVRVGVRHHVVRLSGALASPALRDMAESDAWAVFGVDQVINAIEVVP